MTLPRRRRIALFLLAFGTSFAVATGIALASFGPRRAARVARIVWKVRRGKAAATDLAVLGRSAAGLGFVERLLEENLASEDEKVRRNALLGLVRGFPENRFSQAVRRFEAITGQRYFEGGWAKWACTMNDRGAARAIPLEVAILRWRELIALCPDFPGRDDAGLHLARCEEEAGQARAAFQTLLAARSWGDQDARFTIEDRIACVLDAQLPLADTLELARTQEPRALLAYAASVKLARAHRFEEAVRWLDRVEKLTEAGDVELLGHAPRYFIWRDGQGNEVGLKGTFVSDACQQRALWRKLARLERRGARLDIASRLLDEPNAFTNLILDESVRSDRFGVEALPRRHGNFGEIKDERFLAYLGERSHLVQSARIFEDVARTDSASRAQALVGAAIARSRIADEDGRALPGTRETRRADAERAAARLARELDGNNGGTRCLLDDTRGAEPRNSERGDHGR
jgi:hypothetical protein